jgi:hypothetical protein
MKRSELKKIIKTMLVEESTTTEYVVATNSDYYRVITAAKFEDYGYGWYTPYKGTESECREWIIDHGKVIQESIDTNRPSEEISGQMTTMQLPKGRISEYEATQLFPGSKVFSESSHFGDEYYVAYEKDGTRLAKEVDQYGNFILTPEGRDEFVAVQ